MDPGSLFALLVCPTCRGPLVRAEDRLGCGGCGASYGIDRGGVPILLTAEDGQRLAEAQSTWGGERVPGLQSAGWLRHLLPPPAPFLNLASGRNLARIRRDLGRTPAPLLLDLGSGGGGGAGLGDLGADLRQRHTVCLDVAAFPGVAVVAVGARLPFADATFDAVLLKAVLEHVPDAAAVVAEARRVLRPGGWIYVETPFLFEYHPNPGDYLRFTKAGLEQLLGKFEAVEVGTLVGPFAAAASLLAHATALLLSFGSRLLRKGLLPWLTWVFWPVCLPDLLATRHPSSHFVAHHLYALGRKGGGRRPAEEPRKSPGRAPATMRGAAPCAKRHRRPPGLRGAHGAVEPRRPKPPGDAAPRL